MTHPPIICRTVVKLRDDLLAAIFGFGPCQLELVRHKCESGPIVIGDIDLNRNVYIRD